MEFQLHKTKNTTFPLVERTNDEMARLWHKSVEEFLQELGITRETAHLVNLSMKDTRELETETLIEFRRVVVGTVTTKLANTAAGLKFTITCQKVHPSSPAEPIEDDGVPHEIDYDRGDGTFVTASL